MNLRGEWGNSQIMAPAQAKPNQAKPSQGVKVTRHYPQRQGKLKGKLESSLTDFSSIRNLS